MYVRFNILGQSRAALLCIDLRSGRGAAMFGSILIFTMVAVRRFTDELSQHVLLRLLQAECGASICHFLCHALTPHKIFAMGKSMHDKSLLPCASVNTWLSLPPRAFRDAVLPRTTALGVQHHRMPSGVDLTPYVKHLEKRSR